MSETWKGRLAELDDERLSVADRLRLLGRAQRELAEELEDLLNIAADGVEEEAEEGEEDEA